MGDDLRACRMQPFIAVGVIEMPMGVDQVLDRIGAEFACGLQDPRTRRGDSSVDEHLAVGTGEDRDVAARALEDADVATKLMNLDGSLGRIFADQFHDVAGFGIGLRD